MAEIPAGYYAIIEFGWSEPGLHQIQKFKVNFKSLKALETAEWFNN
jgi:hypothetical protein